mgnify:FL=1
MGIWCELQEPDQDGVVCPDPTLPPVNSYVRLSGDMRIYYDSQRTGPCEVGPDGSYGRVAYHLHEDPHAVGVRWFRHPPGMDDGCVVLTTAEVNLNAIEPVSDQEFDGWLRPATMWHDMTGWRVVAMFGIILLVTGLIIVRIVSG